MGQPNYKHRSEDYYRENADKILSKTTEPILKIVRQYLVKHRSKDLIEKFQPQLNSLVGHYISRLPRHVSDSERDDLANIARLEFLETIKSWDPRKNKDVWPLAYSRVSGAMKDHIRYISKTDPTRLYEWVTNAAHLFLTVEKTLDFEKKIESGIQLDEAMKALDDNEKKVIISHYQEGKPFKEIADSIGTSESQATRIAQRAIKKMREVIG